MVRSRLSWERTRYLKGSNLKSQDFGPVKRYNLYLDRGRPYMVSGRDAALAHDMELRRS